MPYLDGRGIWGYQPMSLFLEETKNEQKNISAEQHESQEDSRLSGALPDQERPGCSASQTRQGKKKISGLTYPRSRRLTRRPQFSGCYDLGRRFFSENFILFVRRREEAEIPWRLGLAVSRKIGSSVRRNRIRRLLREFFRLRQAHVPLGVDIVVVAKRGICVNSMNLAQITAELMPLLRRASEMK